MKIRKEASFFVTLCVGLFQGIFVNFSLMAVFLWQDKLPRVLDSLIIYLGLPFFFFFLGIQLIHLLEKRFFVSSSESFGLLFGISAATLWLPLSGAAYTPGKDMIRTYLRGTAVVQEAVDLPSARNKGYVFVEGGRADFSGIGTFRSTYTSKAGEGAKVLYTDSYTLPIYLDGESPALYLVESVDNDKETTKKNWEEASLPGLEGEKFPIEGAVVNDAYEVHEFLQAARKEHPQTGPGALFIRYSRDFHQTMKKSARWFWTGTGVYNLLWWLLPVKLLCFPGKKKRVS